MGFKDLFRKAKKTTKDAVSNPETVEKIKDGAEKAVEVAKENIGKSGEPSSDAEKVDEGKPSKKSAPAPAAAPVTAEKVVAAEEKAEEKAESPAGESAVAGEEAEDAVPSENDARDETGPTTEEESATVAAEGIAEDAAPAPVKSGPKRYRGKARGSIMVRTGDAGDGKHTYEVIDPAGSDNRRGQVFTLTEDQVEVI